ncbi:MAG: ABC transporter substrate-binding protein, partial [Thermaceae bacterium]|nr:ABC transporter substrate-binding protein [Thermaceae bacterium]
PMRVYLEFDLGGPISVGRGSYVSEALRQLGLINVLAHHPQSYFTPDLEEVLQLEPELIIYEPKPHRMRQAERARALMQSRGWTQPLVVNEGDQLAHYGPLFFEYLEGLERQIEQLES